MLIAIGAWGAESYQRPRLLARFEVPGLTESSGLAASRANPGVLWTHNDSGSGADLYAIRLNGKLAGRWTVPGVKAYDWEDIALGPAPQTRQWFLYIGDIGDNQAARDSVAVYRVREPDLNSPIRTTAPAEVLRFRYPDGPHNAEAMIVHPQSGDLYIITKARGQDGKTRVYKASAPLSAKRTATLKAMSALDFPGQSIFTLITGRVTGAAISPDGRRVMLCDYFGGWEATIPAAAKFDSIWKKTWTPVDLGERQQGESVSYSLDGNSVFATSEGTVMPLIEVAR